MTRSPFTLKQHAYDRILDRLKTGQFAPGMRLSDELLAGELGVSRSPVREAILQLSAEGIIEQRPRQGAFIRMPDRKSLSNEFELRLAVEPFAAGMAAERRTDADMRKLRDLNSKMEKYAQEAVDSGLEVTDHALRLKCLEYDDRSHLLIAKMIDNNRIAEVIRIAQVVMRIFALAVHKPGPAAMLKAAREHRLFVDAIESRDAERATEAMAQHIDFAAKNLLELYDRVVEDGEFSER